MMRASLHWMGEFLPLREPSQELARRLTMAGVEVEATLRPAAGNEGLVVAVVQAAENVSGKVWLRCVVFDGHAEHIVVCGDATVRAGEHVLFAPPGSHLRGTRVEVRRFGAMESQGMLCSLADLGLETKSTGVLRLDAPAGTRAESLLDLSDELWELNLTPNRSDCLSQWGVARELGAILDCPAHLPSLRLMEAAIPISARVRVADPTGCPLYTARVLRGVKIGPSPLWVRVRLESYGMRSINNVVDATNYVLIELGQPLHAFDLAKLSEGVYVRRARLGERLKTLDGVERVLDVSDLVIADARGPVALAGVMGGAESEVGTETMDVLLESAYFDPLSVRRTARRHGLHSEASHRFERGVDPAMVRFASDRCAQLILEWAGGQAEQGRAEDGPGLPPPTPIELRSERMRRLLGYEIAPTQAQRYLERLGCQVVATDHAWRVTPPTWRSDLGLEVDLVEEVCRLHGYAAIPAAQPVSVLGSLPFTEPSVQQVAREWLRDAGFNELVTYSFTAPDLIAAIGYLDDRAHPVPLDKPLTTEQSVMRTELLPSLIEAVSLNLRRGNTALKVFDVSRVFRPATGKPMERLHLGIAAFGSWDDSVWGSQGRRVEFYDLKGVVEGFFERLGIEAAWVPTREPFMHPGIGADILVGSQSIGWLGQLHPRLLRQLELPPGIVAEIDLEMLSMPAQSQVQIPSRFPAVMRDLAFLVPKAIPAGRVADVLRTSGPAFLESVKLFDVYEAASLGARKNVAYHLRFQAQDRTLTDDEVDAAVATMVEAARRELGAELRA